MTEIPDVPDKFESEEEFQRYADQLYDQIKLLEGKLEDSEKNEVELKQELEEAQNSSTDDRQAKIEAVASILSNLEAKFSDTQDHLEDRGNLNRSVVDTISNITEEDYD